MRVALFVVMGAIAALPVSAAELKSAKDCNIELKEHEFEIQRAARRNFIDACWKSEVGKPTPFEQKSAEPMPAQPSTVPSEVAKPASSQFQTLADAEQGCPNQLVVWLNTRSKMLHLPDSKYFGATDEGTYMCASDALRSGGWRANPAIAEHPRNITHKRNCHCRRRALSFY